MPVISDILTAVSLKLRGSFRKPVYGDEPVSQGMERPCFFICLTEAGETLMPSGRMRLEAPLDIVYFPRIAGSYTEMRQIGQELFILLQLLQLPDGTSVRGRKRKFDIIDGALHFFITFTVHLLPAEADVDKSDILMDDLDLQMGLD